MLKAIEEVDLKRVDSPIIPEFEFEHNLVDAFKKAMKINHAEVIETVGEEETVAQLKVLSADYNRICSAFPIKDLDCTYAREVSDPRELKDINLGVIRGMFGVAENGAIWVPEENCHQRVLPFIVEHLIIVLKADSLVSNMNRAYQSVELVKTGFGVFISGPSKTGDIEQTLVIGAHGPRSLKVILEK